MYIRQNFPLTRSTVQQLVALGADIQRGDVALCDLRTVESKNFFLSKVMALPEDQDPLIHPTFGHPNTVTAEIQQEVFNVISTYQGLLAADFAGGALVPIGLADPVPAAMMWRFHHSQMAIVGVINRLANPHPGAHCQTIHNLPPGQFVCDVSVIYGNAVFVVHISRSTI